jgi:hypothetical protein
MAQDVHCATKVQRWEIAGTDAHRLGVVKNGRAIALSCVGDRRCLAVVQGVNRRPGDQTFKMSYGYLVQFHNLNQSLAHELSQLIRIVPPGAAPVTEFHSNRFDDNQLATHQTCDR